MPCKPNTVFGVLWLLAFCYIFTVAVSDTHSHMMPALQCPAITSVTEEVDA